MDSGERKNIAIITPYPLTLHGLDRLLESEEGKNGSLIVTKTAHTPSDALETLAQKPSADVALIDLAIGDHEPNFAFVSRIRELHAQLSIVTISQSTAPVYLELARSVGAQGHLSYHCVANTLCETLRRASSILLPATPTGQGEFAKIISLITPLQKIPDDERRRLTLKQRKIYDLLGTGKEYHAIARLLNVQPGTIQQHLYQMTKRLGYKHSREVYYCAARRALLLELKEKKENYPNATPDVPILSIKDEFT